MKIKKEFYIAFILNLIFSVIELIGGILTGSIAIISDAVHDFGDATSIGTSLLLEKKSEKKADDKYTLGYARFSVLGGLITTVILIVGSGMVIYNAILRIISPVSIHYDGMLILAGAGLIINFFATLFTHGGKSINQKAVFLHMLEDVLGWAIILVGALVMHFTNFYLLDPILSILVALIILLTSIKNLNEIFAILLMKKPKEVNVEEVKSHVLSVEGVLKIEYANFWTMDGEDAFANMKILITEQNCKIKNKVKQELYNHGFSHITIETEIPTDITLEIPQNKSSHHKAHCHHHH